MNYFVITKTDGLLSAGWFARVLAAKWPLATLEEVSNPQSHHALEFRVPMTHSRVDGSLDREGNAIIFTGDLRDCAGFALWCRSIIPAQEPLTFCDEGMYGSLTLEEGTTAEDIFRVFRYQPPPGRGTPPD